MVMLVMAVAVFHRPLLLYSVQKMFHVYCYKQLGAYLNIESIAWEEGHIVLQEGHLVDKEGLPLASFTSIHVQPKFRFTHRTWGGHVIVLGLKLWPTHPFSTLSHSRMGAQSRILGCNPDVHMVVEDALIMGGEQPIPLEMNFRIKKQGVFGHMVIHDDQQPLELLLSSQGQRLECAVTLRQHPVAALQTVVQTLLRGKFLKIPWQLIQGEMQGYAMVLWEQGELMHCQGHLELQHVYARHVSSLQERHIPQAIVEFSLQEGQVQHALISGELLGVTTHLVLDWDQDPEVMTLSCQGNIPEEIYTFLPLHCQGSCAQVLEQAPWSLEASIERQEDSLQLKGRLWDAQEHSIDFGCQLGGEALPQDLNVPTFCFTPLGRQFYLHETCLGWFTGYELPVQQFIAPLLLGSSHLQLSGWMDLEGSFNRRYLGLMYQGKDLLLEGATFSLQVPKTQKQGAHYFHLETGEHAGYLLLQDADYTQRNLDLQLCHMSGAVRFENHKIVVQDMAVNWEGLPLQGQLQIDLPSYEDVSLLLKFNCNEGDLVAGKHLLSHFATTFLETLDLQGTFHIKPGDAYLALRCLPKLEILGGDLRGTTTFGWDLGMTQLSQGATHFAYDFGMQKLCLTGLTASSTWMGHTMALQSGTCDVANGQWRMAADIVGLQPEPLSIQGSKEHNHLAILGENLSLQCEIKPEAWHVHQIIWRDYRGSAEISHDALSYRLQHLTLAHPRMGRCEISGLWEKESQEATGGIVMEAYDLGLCLPPSMEPWGVNGTFSGTGTLTWSPLQGLSVHMEGAHRNLEFGSLYFGDSDALKLYYHASKGLLVEGLEALGLYRLGALHYDPRKQHAYFEGFDFCLTPDKLPWLFDIATKLLPSHLDASVCEMVAQLKGQDPLCGRLWLDLDPSHRWIHLKLQEGDYCLGQQLWHLKDFSLVYDPQEICIKTSLDLGHVESQLHLTADSETLSKGILALQQKDADDMLTAVWRRYPEIGYVIEKVEGSFMGVSCALSPTIKDPDVLKLEGHLSCKPQTAYALFPQVIRDYVQAYQIKGLYTLKGTFTFPKQDLVHPHFVGELTSQECSFATIGVASLTAHCEIKPQILQFSNIALRDWAGDLYCDRCEVRATPPWSFQADHIALHDFRLSRLESVWTKRERGTRPSYRSLFISTCEVNGLQGCLQDLKSFVAKGQVSFTNIPKRTLLSNLMMIPAEITARIGLDPTIFIPAKGTVHYQLEEGRIHMLDFEDVYSDGKYSRFYLVDHQPSYVGLDGTINLHIRMKQYNLLMKLTELFNLTVQGTLLEPEYFFTGQDVGMEPPK